jgi:hypothetical protein
MPLLLFLTLFEKQARDARNHAARQRCLRLA